MLQLHILELEGEELAVLAAECYHLLGAQGVDMHLYARAVAHNNKGVSVNADVLNIAVEVE